MSELNNELNENEKIQGNSVSDDSFEGNESELSTVSDQPSAEASAVSGTISETPADAEPANPEPTEAAGAEPEKSEPTEVTAAAEPVKAEAAAENIAANAEAENAGQTDGEKKEKRKKILKICGGVVAAIVAIYCLIAFTYQSKFTTGTIINGIDASGMTLDEYTEAGFKRVVDEEEIIDTYEDKLTTYISRLNSNELDPTQAGAVQKYLHSLTDFERMSDHALNLAECARELHEKGLEFSAPAKKEIRVLRSAVTEVLDISIGGFIDNDIELAYHVEPLEELIDDLCREMKLHHVERAQKGLCGVTQGFIYNDVLTNYERISDHCSNIAVAMIEIQSGEFEAHSYVEGVLAMHSHSFDKYFNEYSEKYNLDKLGE